MKSFYGIISVDLLLHYPLSSRRNMLMIKDLEEQKAAGQSQSRSHAKKSNSKSCRLQARQRKANFWQNVGGSAAWHSQPLGKANPNEEGSS
jgi:hypothetical protein